MADYRPGNILDKEPNTIAAAVFAVINAFLIVGTWEIEPDALLAGNTALVLVLSLFVRTKSTSNSTATLLLENAEQATEVRVKSDVDAYLNAASAKAAPYEDRAVPALVESSVLLAEVRDLMGALTEASENNKP